MIVIGTEFCMGAFKYRCIHAPESGDYITTHRHNFTHNGIVHKGKFLLQVLELDNEQFDDLRRVERIEPDGGDGRRFIIYTEDGQIDKKPLGSSVKHQVIVDSDNKFPILEVKAGIFHRFISLQDDSRMMCCFVHVDHVGKIHESYQGFDLGYV